jgi:hypothetical protein
MRRLRAECRVRDDEGGKGGSGDPRLSVEERYPTFLDYYYKVSKAINDMVAERFMLPEDAGRR